MCRTALFEDVVVAIHSYVHPRVEKTVELFNRKFGCLAYDLPRGRRNLSPTLLKFLGNVMSVKPRRQGVASNPTHVNLLLFCSILSHPLQLTFVKLPKCQQSCTAKKVDYLMVIVCRQTGYVC